METPLVVKLGGAALESPNALVQLLHAIREQCATRPWLLVHGGGSLVDQWLSQLGFATEKKDGQRITPAEQMPFISGALAGYSNLCFVQFAKQAGCTAVGLSLADAEGLPFLIHSELGAVGTPDWSQLASSSSYHALISGLWQQGFVPVISSVGVAQKNNEQRVPDSNLQLLNVNADLAAASLASLLNAELLLLSDVSAILDHEGKAIAQVSLGEADTFLAQDFIQGGMRVKLMAAIEATRLCRRSTAITSWRDADAVVSILQGGQAGTRILC